MVSTIMENLFEILTPETNFLGKTNLTGLVLEGETATPLTQKLRGH